MFRPVKKQSSGDMLQKYTQKKATLQMKEISSLQMFSLKDIESHAVPPRVASVLANIKALIH
jgi:hypothetical protein